MVEEGGLMKERKKLKWLLLMAVTAIMLMASAVSVSAATYNKAYRDIIVKIQLKAYCSLIFR